MATTNGNRRMIDMKRWELSQQCPVNVSGGCFFATAPHHTQLMMYGASNASAGISLYDPYEDGWMGLSNPALAGLNGLGFHGCATAVGPSGTATGSGSTTTLLTNLALTVNLKGYKIHITGGPAAGDVRTIKNNTVGTNSTITVETAFSASTTASTTYRLLTPRWYVTSASSSSNTAMKFYCLALGSWIQHGTNSLPISASNEVRLVATPSFYGSDFVSFATGTATSATATTLSNSAKNWATNQWTNSQVRITSGTGAGQIRTISSNTGTQLTVSANWTTTPDATSGYSIEGNDDYLYMTGNNSAGLWRLTISTGTWTTMASRNVSYAAGNGLSAHWINKANDDTWKDENNIQNGRYIYSFRGGNSFDLQRYDIAANTWPLNITNYDNAIYPFTTGSRFAERSGIIYCYHNNTQRLYRFDVVRNQMLGTTLYPLSVTTEQFAPTMEICEYFDGDTKIPYLYMAQGNQVQMLRMMIIP